MRPPLNFVVLPLLAACGTGPPRGEETGPSSEEDSAAPGLTGADVSVTVADTSWLPSDEAVTFDIHVQADGGGELLSPGSVDLGDTVRVEIEPGDWKVSASFSWNDPTKRDTDTTDTGGYWATECYGTEDVTVASGEVATVVITAECADEYGD